MTASQTDNRIHDKNEAHAEALIIEDNRNDALEAGEYRQAWRMTQPRAIAIHDEGLEEQEWEWDHRHDEDYWD
jgi:hypothetical protein